MEFYNGTPILYSVGNFIFDQMFSVQTARRADPRARPARRQDASACGPAGVEIEDFNQPRLMSAASKPHMDRFWDAADRIAARG